MLFGTCSDILSDILLSSMCELALAMRSGSVRTHNIDELAKEKEAIRKKEEEEKEGVTPFIKI